MKLKEIPVTRIDSEPAKRCSDYDDECKDVKEPIVCWSGVTMPPVDGYCPLMFPNIPQ